MTDSYPTLSRAPLVEALLDIQIAPQLPEDQLTALQAIASRVPEYPDVAPRASIMATMQGFGAGLTLSQQHGIIGFAFSNKEKNRVFHARLTGFSLSFLAPYTSFTELAAESYRLWPIYREAVKVHSIIRVALRYINRFELPLPFADFSEFLRTYPELAPGIPQGLSEYSMRLVIPDVATRSVAIVTQLLEPQSPNVRSIPMLFDIDVFQMIRKHADDDSLWEVIDELRAYKNQIFFRSITDKLQGMFA